MAEQKIDLSQDMDPELYQEFLTDSYEHLAAIEQGILSMETDPDDRGAVDNVFRAFHTFKGNAGFLGLEPIAELAHRLESLLESVRSGDLASDSNVVNLILSGGDALEKYVSTISNQVSGKEDIVPFSYDNSDLLADLDKILASLDSETEVQADAESDSDGEKIHENLQDIVEVDETPAADSTQTQLAGPEIEPPTEPVNETPAAPTNEQPQAEVKEISGTDLGLPQVDPIEDPVEFINQDSELPTGSENEGDPKAEEKVVEQKVLAEDSKKDEPEPVQRPKVTTKERAPAGEHSGSVKVATHKLDSLVDMVGEFVIAQSQVMQSMRNEGDVGEEVARNLVQLSRISKDLQRTAMSLRMVPIRNTFQKMNRLVRDVASKQGKKVQLILEGEETEIDRNIVEAIHDPLVHMIRNSVDHGIEQPATRTSEGKSPEGTIILRAYHQAGNIRIEICDDGAGLDKNRILDKAISKNLIEKGVEMNDSEVYNLIFTPGFSTAEKITDISGRGVGMDVVKRNITKLRGKIEITSEKGRGSTFVISLPLTLAIIEGLQVRIGAHCYIIPVNSVIESFRLKSGVTTKVQGRGQLIRVRDQQIPMLDLRDYFHINGNGNRTENSNQERVVIILESENQKRCVVVDELLGKNEVVIKNLGNIFATDPAISGATILGDGMVGLILEPSVLVRLPAAA